MIRLAGKQPGRDIAIVYTGLRPGEKLHETLFHADERYRPTAHPKILQAEPRDVSHDVIARARSSSCARPACATTCERSRSCCARRCPNSRRQPTSAAPQARRPWSHSRTQRTQDLMTQSHPQEPSASARPCFPVAGLGTRFLPATKTVPKEMLPIIDRPLIQYAVDEAIEAGCDTLVFVTNRYKHAVADYFDKAYELEQKLEQAGKTELLELIRDVLPPRRARGVRHPGRGAGPGPRRAVREAGDRRRAVRGAAARRPDLEPRPRRAEADGRLRRSATGASVIAVQDVPREQTGSYGIVATERFRRTARAASARSSRSPSPRSRRARSPWSAATCSSARIFDLLEQRAARRRRRDPAHRRHRRAAGGAARAGLSLRGHALRLRHATSA